MTASDKGTSDTRPGTRKGDGTRADRLRAALRENLKRRKLQVKGRAKEGSTGRAEVAQDSSQGASHDSAGFVPDKSKD